MGRLLLCLKHSMWFKHSSYRVVEHLWQLVPAREHWNQNGLFHPVHLLDCILLCVMCSNSTSSCCLFAQRLVLCSSQRCSSSSSSSVHCSPSSRPFSCLRLLTPAPSISSPPYSWRVRSVFFWRFITALHHILGLAFPCQSISADYFVFQLACSTICSNNPTKTHVWVRRREHCALLCCALCDTFSLKSSAFFFFCNCQFWAFFLIIIRIPRSSELMMLFAGQSAKMCSSLNGHLRLAGKMSRSL